MLQQHEMCCRILSRFPSGICVHDLDGTIVFVNPSFCEYSGYDENELLGMRVHAIDTEIDARGDCEKIWKQMHPNDTLRFEVTHRRKDGTVFPAEVYLAPIKVADETAIMVTVKDLTKQKEWEFALKTSEAQLVNAVNIAQIGHWEYDVATNLFRFNDHFYNILGTTADEVGGYEMTPEAYAERFLHPDDLHIVAEETRLCLETDDPNHTRVLEHRIIYPNGEIGYFLVRIFIAKDKHGRTIKTFGANQNITDRKRQELAQKQLETQLIRSRRLETIGTLAGGIAHDFNNILTPILGYAEMGLSSLAPTEPLFEDFQEIRTATVRAKELIAKIMTFSRHLERERQPVNLALLVDDALNLLKSSIPNRITLKRTLDMEAGLVMADASEIHQIAANLCSNSVSAISGQGAICIDLSRVHVGEDMIPFLSGLQVGDHICLSVSDTGEGMDEETIDRVFEPFFTTKELDKGRGMGLSVVHGIVQSHHGGVTVESQKGEGTTFKVYFPIHS